MAVIVRHTESGSRYILLSGGFGAYASSRPGVVLGNVSPTETWGDVRVALVCDESGRAAWVESDVLVVESIDGDHPSVVLNAD